MIYQRLEPLFVKTTAYSDKMKTDNKGQSSAELILIIGGLIVIILFIGTYISNITDTTQNKLKTVITKERNFLINKI
jgi:uncharacterized protein (UPF0333 family)